MTENIRKYIAEVVGTFILVFVGSLAILSIGRGTQIGLDPNIVAIALGFGLALLAALYAVGEISGGHFNPAVSFGAFLDKRLALSGLIGYVIAQVAGAVLASVGIAWVADTDAVAATATVPGAGVGGGTAFLVEVVLTAIFVMVILKVTASADQKSTVFLAISLTLVAIHVAAVPISGASVNPARTLGPAIVGTTGTDLWIYLVAPFVGAAIGWVLYKVTTEGKVALDVDMG